MKVNVNREKGIRNVSSETWLHLKLLAVVYNQTMGEMLTSLVERAYNEDKIDVTKRAKTKMKRIIKKWRP